MANTEYEVLSIEQKENMKMSQINTINDKSSVYNETVLELTRSPEYQ